MTNRNDYLEDELSLLDIYQVLKVYWRSIIITPLLLALIAFVFTRFLVTPSYEAQAIIDVGRVNEALLESPDIVIDRLNHPGFIQRVVDEHINIFGDQKKTLKNKHFVSFLAKKSKNSDLIFISLRNKNHDRSQLEVSAVIETLIGIHHKIFEDKVEFIKQRITSIDYEIERIKADKILKGVFSKEANDKGLKVTIVNDQGHDLSALIDLKLKLEMSLSSKETYNTRQLEHIYISDDLVSRNLPIVTLVAFLLGLFGAVFAAFVRNSLKA